MDTLRRFVADDCGADLVEYALVVGLISLAAFGAMSGIGPNIRAMFDTLQLKIAAIAF